MNDLLIPKIKKTLAVIERTCNKLHQEETLDDGEVYHAAKVIERQAQQLLAVTNVTKEMNKDFLVLVAKATEELMASSEADIQHVAERLAISPSMLRRKLSTATDGEG